MHADVTNDATQCLASTSSSNALVHQYRSGEHHAKAPAASPMRSGTASCKLSRRMYGVGRVSHAIHEHPCSARPHCDSSNSSPTQEDFANPHCTIVCAIFAEGLRSTAIRQPFNCEQTPSSPRPSPAVSDAHAFGGRSRRTSRPLTTEEREELSRLGRENQQMMCRLLGVSDSGFDAHEVLRASAR